MFHHQTPSRNRRRRGWWAPSLLLKTFYSPQIHYVPDPDDSHEVQFHLMQGVEVPNGAMGQRSLCNQRQWCYIRSTLVFPFQPRSNHPSIPSSHSFKQYICLLWSCYGRVSRMTNFIASERIKAWLNRLFMFCSKLFEVVPGTLSAGALAAFFVGRSNYWLCWIG